MLLVKAIINKVLHFLLYEENSVVSQCCRPVRLMDTWNRD